MNIKCLEMMIVTNKSEFSEREFMKLAKLYFVLVGYGTSGDLAKVLNSTDFSLSNQGLSQNKCGALLRLNKDDYSFMNDIRSARVGFGNGNSRIIYYYKPYEAVVKSELGGCVV